MTALRVEALEAGYEPGLPIVRRASLSVEANEIVAVLGPNGAGKSTLIKAIAGLVPISAGRVLLHDREITGRAAHRLPHEGLGFVPQTENVFVNLSIDDNLDLAASILKVPKKRRPTKPPRASKEARLKEKKQRSEVKRTRSKVDSDE